MPSLHGGHRSRCRSTAGQACAKANTQTGKGAWERQRGQERNKQSDVDRHITPSTVAFDDGPVEQPKNGAPHWLQRLMSLRADVTISAAVRWIRAYAVLRIFAGRLPTLARGLVAIAPPLAAPG